MRYGVYEQAESFLNIWIEWTRHGFDLCLSLVDDKVLTWAALLQEKTVEDLLAYLKEEPNGR